MCIRDSSESFENVWEPVKHPCLTSVYDYKFIADDFDGDFSKEENAKKWIKGKSSRILQYAGSQNS
jgi:hypothetical protein